MHKLICASVLLTMLATTACAHVDGRAALYGLETRVSPEQLHAGGQATVAFEIKMKEGAHFSDGAPISASLTAQNLTITRRELTRADAEVLPDAACFKVPVTARAAGPAPLDAELTFYLCTETFCELQSRHVTVPLVVE